MVWIEQLSVGNSVIDSDHKRLFGLINDIACAAKTSDRFALSLALKLFKDYMNHHSVNEEQFAQAFNIPFGMHKVAHQNLQMAIDFTMRELEKNSTAILFVMEHYAQFLLDWLVKHITEEDMLMKSELQTHPYDFRPVGHTELAQMKTGLRKAECRRKCFFLQNQHLEITP